MALDSPVGDATVAVTTWSAGVPGIAAAGTHGRSQVSMQSGDAVLAASADAGLKRAGPADGASRALSATVTDS